MPMISLGLISQRMANNLAYVFHQYQILCSGLQFEYLRVLRAGYDRLSLNRDRRLPKEQDYVITLLKSKALRTGRRGNSTGEKTILGCEWPGSLQARCNQYIRPRQSSTRTMENKSCYTTDWRTQRPPERMKSATITSHGSRSHIISIILSLPT